MAALSGFALRAMCQRLAPFVAATVIAGTAATAWAFWTTNAAAGSHGAATAATILQGATPSATLTSIGREVAISWGASTLSNGAPVDGYSVKRYPAGGGIGAISPIGTCSGTVASLGCAEDDVPGSMRSRQSSAHGKVPKACSAASSASAPRRST